MQARATYAKLQVGCFSKTERISCKVPWQLAQIHQPLLNLTHRRRQGSRAWCCCSRGFRALHQGLSHTPIASQPPWQFWGSEGQKQAALFR